MLRSKSHPYILFNAITAGIVILIFAYSGIFSSSGIPHPIQSQYTQPVASTGLSRAFSEIIRLNFQDAKQLNPFSIKLFLFFFIQLFLRGLSILMLLSSQNSQKLLFYSDVLLSVLLFLWAFSEFVIFQFKFYN